MDKVKHIVFMIENRIKEHKADKERCTTVTCLEIQTAKIKELNSLHKQICEYFLVGSDE